MLKIRAWQNLYIHVPFCAGKCDYCAFYSEGDGGQWMQPWLDRILIQMREISHPDKIHTVYLGGGTPVLLPPVMLQTLLAEIHKLFSASEEISIEANPECLDDARAELLGQYVNRVSMGIQSFDPVLRKRIGRHGDPDKIYSAVELLRKNGLQNLGCDLIYALPGQTDSQWERDLRMALDLGIYHLSAYSLTVEEGTPLQRRYHPGNEAEDRSAELEEITRSILPDAGMNRYEISNYAQKGFECRHNRNVWYGETYAGIGPAACSFNGVDRFTQCTPVSRWLAGVPAETDTISERQRLGEIFIMGLRTVQGWPPGLFEQNTGVDPADLWNKEIDGLRKCGWMKPSAYALTDAGLNFWNDCAEVFI